MLFVVKTIKIKPLMKKSKKICHTARLKTALMSGALLSAKARTANSSNQRQTLTLRKMILRRRSH